MIKFPPKDELGREKTYTADVNSLSADHAHNAFCPRFSNAYAVAFDSVAADFSNWTGKTISSVDAVLDQRANQDVQRDLRHIYFIEFKNRRYLDLNSQGTSAAATTEQREDVSIGDELRQKGLGSMLLSGATLFKNECLDNVSFLSEYIVVYNDRRHVPTESKSVKAFDEDMSRLAGSCDDSYDIPILWELNKLKSKGIFRHVHTWSIDDFNRYAPDFVK